MSRQRRAIPREVESAQQRVNGLVSIEETLDLGNGVSVAALQASIRAVMDEVNEYNTMISNADEKSNRVDALVDALNDLNSRALKGVESRYGKDSNEYEKAGGTRKSDRKRPIRKSGGGTGAVK